ncbi:hypothetical protein COBT_002823 [Conglomerata obtusa]
MGKMGETEKTELKHTNDEPCRISAANVETSSKNRQNRNQNNLTQKNLTFDTLLDITKAKQEKWASDVYDTILTRFGRMPRKGWDKMTRFYNTKFNCETSIHQIKRAAQKILTDENGNKKQVGKYEEIRKKRRKIVQKEIETKTYAEHDKSENTRRTFLSEYNELLECKITENNRTKKIPY